MQVSPYMHMVHVPYDSYPISQKTPIKHDDRYEFVRTRLGKQTVSESGQPFGHYLYRNIRTSVLIASHDAPKSGQHQYYGSDIGIFSDAIIYYKNG